MNDSSQIQLQQKSRTVGAKGKTILITNKKKPEHVVSLMFDAAVGKDVTPRPLNPDVYVAGNERQLGEVIGTGDWQGMDTFSLTGQPSLNFFKSQSTVRFRTDLDKQYVEQSIQFKGSLSQESSYMDVFLVDSSSERSVESGTGTYRSEDADFIETRTRKLPNHISLVLSETTTCFLLDIPSSTVIKDSEEGAIVEEQNILYEFMTVGKGRNRKVVQAEVQTVPILKKTQNTDAARIKTHGEYAYASIWEMYDTLQEAIGNKGEESEVSDSSEMEYEGIDEKDSVDSYRLSSDEKQLIKLIKNPRFLEAVCVTERLLANNYYNEQQKIFRGLCEPDPFRENIEYKYNLNLLWTFANVNTQGKSVNALHWNPKNTDLLAVGYGKFYFADNISGLVLIWNIKNPVQPERQYSFPESVTSLNFSTNNPNLLAVGFYSGYIAVLNVVSRDILIVGDNEPTFEPVWHISWEAGYFEHSTKELVCATFSDGRIVVYQLARKLQAQQIMRVAKSDGILKGYRSMRKCTNLKVPVSRYSSATVLVSHPVQKQIYLIGTDEGIIHKCSTNYFNQHLDSFSAHDGPIHAIKFSPFSKKLFVTCGDDWHTKFWAEDISEPILESFVSMQSVHGMEWSPTHSTLVVTIRGPNILVVDLQRKCYLAQSTTPSPTGSRNTVVKFTNSGRCLVVGDIDGNVHMFSLENVPFQAFFQENLLFEALFKLLITNPTLTNKLKKIRRSSLRDQSE